MHRSLFSIIALCCSLSGQAWATPPIEAVTEADSYSFIENGKVGGVASEIAEQMFQKAGLLDYHFSLYPWARAYDIALLQPNVLIYPIMRTPSREAQFKWVGELDRMTPQFYKLREDHSFSIASLEDARRFTIGVVRDDVRHEYLQSHDFTRLVISPNNIENFRKLLNHQIQLIALPEREARQLCDDAHIAYSDLQGVYSLTDMSSGLYYAYSLGTADDIVARTRVAFEQIKAAGGLNKVKGDR